MQLETSVDQSTDTFSFGFSSHFTTTHHYSNQCWWNGKQTACRSSLMNKSWDELLHLRKPLVPNPENDEIKWWKDGWGWCLQKGSFLSLHLFSNHPVHAQGHHSTATQERRLGSQWLSTLHLFTVPRNFVHESYHQGLWQRPVIQFKARWHLHNAYREKKGKPRSRAGSIVQQPGEVLTSVHYWQKCSPIQSPMITAAWREEEWHHSSRKIHLKPDLAHRSAFIRHQYV